MQSLCEQESNRLIRYHGQSLRLLGNAIDQIRQGRWLHCEDLLWGSLSLAVKGVALSRGDLLSNQQAIKDYSEKLGNEHRDRRIRNAFTKLAGFYETAERAQECNMSADRLVALLEDISGAVERLWQLLPDNETADNPLEACLQRSNNLLDGDGIDR